MRNEIKVFMLVAVGLLAPFSNAQESEKKEDIKTLLSVSGSSEMGVQVASQLVATFSESLPDVPKEFWDRFKDSLQEEELTELIVPIYDKYYTHQEIKDLIVFYRTPLGQKVIRVLPQITQESMQVGQAWGQQLGKKVYQDLVAEGYVKQKK